MVAVQHDLFRINFQPMSMLEGVTEPKLREENRVESSDNTEDS
jgi:hypothetical protein